jgi:hypothetical protein
MRRKPIEDDGVRFTATGEQLVRYHDLDDEAAEPDPDPFANPYAWRDTWEVRPRRRVDDDRDD